MQILLVAGAVCASFLTAVAAVGWAEDAGEDQAISTDLTELELEDLTEVTLASASKRVEELSEVPATVIVIAPGRVLSGKAKKTVAHTVSGFLVAETSCC